MISAAGFSLISIGREVRVAASSGRSLTCESILRGENVGIFEERERRRGKGGDSHDRFKVVGAGVKQGLDHSEGKLGVLGTSGSLLGLFFSRLI